MVTSIIRIRLNIIYIVRTNIQSNKSGDLMLNLSVLVLPNQYIIKSQHSMTRSVSSYRPVLRVSDQQQFDQLSPVARVLISNLELLAGITFKGRPSAARRCLDNCRTLAASIISFGC